jgi:hypothetical protein
MVWPSLAIPIGIKVLSLGLILFSKNALRASGSEEREASKY